MFENANLNSINQTLEGLNIDEYNFLKENVGYISTYNTSNYSAEDVLWSKLIVPWECLGTSLP